MVRWQVFLGRMSMWLHDWEIMCDSTQLPCWIVEEASSLESHGKDPTCGETDE